MRLSTLTLLTALAAPTAAAAHGFDKPGPPLDELLAKSRETKKPVLLDFSTIW